MKKTIHITFVIIVIAFVAIMSILIAMILNNNREAREITSHNRQFEQYKGQRLRGTEMASIINKVSDMNRRNNVERTAQGEFINNYENSINIQIKMLVFEDIIDEEEVFRHETFTMEQVYRMGIVNFVQAFNFVTFELVDIEYHQQTGRIKLMTFEQLEA